MALRRSAHCSLISDPSLRNYCRGHDIQRRLCERDNPILRGIPILHALDKIAEQLGKVAYDEKVILNSDRKLVHVPPSALADYAGHYSVPPFAITISVEGDQLIATTPGGRRYNLYSDSQTEFFLKEIDVQVDLFAIPRRRKLQSFL